MKNNHTQSPMIINDAVHKVMSLPREYHKLTKSINDYPTFQRLRHIKQLGMAEFVFPTAVHNRFSHCVGASYIAYQIAEKVTKRMKLEEIEKANVIKYALASSLLHDIGHGPFSHAFEKLLIKKDGDKKNTIKHEDWTDYFIQDLQDILRESDIDHKKVSQMIQKKYELKENDPLNIAADITSSQLDADRLDYLLRDSHFCGVPYGHTDIAWILNHLVAIDKETGPPPRLGILDKGWRAVEDFLLCRRAMTQNVYFHHKINAIQYLMVEFLKKVSNSLFDEKNKKKENIYRNKIDQEMINFLINAHKFRNDPYYSKDEFISENYAYYKILTDHHVWMMINYLARDERLEISFTSSEIYDLARILYNRNLHKSFRFPITAEGAVHKIVKDMKEKNKMGIFDWEFFILESNIQTYEKNDDPILVINDIGQVYRLQEYSEVLKYLPSEKEGYLEISKRIWENKKDEIKKSDLSKYIDFSPDD